MSVDLSLPPPIARRLGSHEDPPFGWAPGPSRRRKRKAPRKARRKARRKK